MRNDDLRRRLVAVAHLAAKRAGVDEETRRAVQRKVTGVESCAQMDTAALQALVRYWQRHGVDVSMPGPRVRAAEDRAPLIAKIAAQCAAQRLPFPAYPLGILRQMLGHELPSLAWATAPVLRSVVAALEYRRRRHARSENRA